MPTCKVLVFYGAVFVSNILAVQRKSVEKSVVEVAWVEGPSVGSGGKANCFRGGNNFQRGIRAVEKAQYLCALDTECTFIWSHYCSGRWWKCYGDVPIEEEGDGSSCTQVKVALKRAENPARNSTAVVGFKKMQGKTPDVNTADAARSEEDERFGAARFAQDFKKSEDVTAASLKTGSGTGGKHVPLKDPKLNKKNEEVKNEEPERFMTKRFTPESRKPESHATLQDKTAPGIKVKHVPVKEAHSKKKTDRESFAGAGAEQPAKEEPVVNEVFDTNVDAVTQTEHKPNVSTGGGKVHVQGTANRAAAEQTVNPEADAGAEVVHIRVKMTEGSVEKNSSTGESRSERDGKIESAFSKPQQKTDIGVGVVDIKVVDENGYGKQTQVGGSSLTRDAWKSATAAAAEQRAREGEEIMRVHVKFPEGQVIDSASAQSDKPLGQSTPETDSKMAAALSNPKQNMDAGAAVVDVQVTESSNIDEKEKGETKRFDGSSLARDARVEQTQGDVVQIHVKMPEVDTATGPPSQQEMGKGTGVADAQEKERPPIHKTWQGDQKRLAGSSLARNDSINATPATAEQKEKAGEEVVHVDVKVPEVKVVDGTSTDKGSPAWETRPARDRKVAHAEAGVVDVQVKEPAREWQGEQKGPGESTSPRNALNTATPAPAAADQKAEAGVEVVHVRVEMPDANAVDREPGEVRPREGGSSKPQQVKDNGAGVVDVQVTEPATIDEGGPGKQTQAVGSSWTREAWKTAAAQAAEQRAKGRAEVMHVHVKMQGKAAEGTSIDKDKKSWQNRPERESNMTPDPVPASTKKTTDTAAGPVDVQKREWMIDESGQGEQKRSGGSSLARDALKAATPAPAEQDTEKGMDVVQVHVRMPEANVVNWTPPEKDAGTWKFRPERDGASKPRQKTDAGVVDVQLTEPITVDETGRGEHEGLGGASKTTTAEAAEKKTAGEEIMHVQVKMPEVKVVDGISVETGNPPGERYMKTAAAMSAPQPKTSTEAGVMHVHVDEAQNENRKQFKTYLSAQDLAAARKKAHVWAAGDDAVEKFLGELVETTLRQVNHVVNE